MRVMMTTDAVGGIWQYSLDLASGLSARGFEISLVVLGPPPTPERESQALALPGVELICPGLPVEWLAHTPDEVEQGGRALAKLARRLRVDLVHLNAPALAASANFDVPLIAVGHSCVKTWWEAVRGTELPAEFVWRSALVREGLERADATCAPSRAFAEALTRVYGLRQRPYVIHNGRSRVQPSRTASVPPWPFVFTAGRLWDEGKNVRVLDRAAPHFAVPCFAAGPLQGPDGSIAALDHLEPVGSLSDATLAAWLAAQPIFVSTALYEPFGLSVLEAARSGCPLILSDIPTFRELWNGAAEFVDPHDAGALAAAVNGLACDADRRQRLGAAAQQRSRRYSVETMIDGVRALYARMLQTETARERVPA